MYFPTGATALEPAIPSSAAFTSLARQMLATALYPSALATASAEATAPTVQTFPTAAQRDAAYASRLAAPGDTVWLAKMTKDAEGDWISSAVKKIAATTVTVRQTDWKTQLPWVIGGAVVIAAAVFFTRSRKKTRAPARKRARPSWRRRIVTTWR